MFTVGDLIAMLQDFDEDMPVRIGMVQRYGTNFVYDVDEVEENGVEAFYGDDYKAVMIMMGSQLGAINFNNDCEDED